MINLITQTRYGVSETNSSSSHSMCINTNVRNDVPDIDRERVINLLNGAGIWRINGDNNYFERGPVQLIEEFSDKVQYALAWFDSGNVTKDWREQKIKEITDVIKKYVPEFNGFEFVGIYEKGFGYARNSEFGKWLTENNISIEDFLTKRRYFVIVDGDEHNIFTGMADLGMIDSAVRITTSWDG